MKTRKNRILLLTVLGVFIIAVNFGGKKAYAIELPFVPVEDTHNDSDNNGNASTNNKNTENTGNNSQDNNAQGNNSQDNNTQGGSTQSGG